MKFPTHTHTHTRIFLHRHTFFKLVSYKPKERRIARDMIYFQAHIPCNQYLLLLKADSRCFSNKNLGLKNLLFIILSLSFIVDNMMLLEVYMVVNFRTRRINRGAHKLVRTIMLIIKQRLTITL
jgi:hypothetical protein